MFQRILRRLQQEPRWVLKGGFSLELRLGLAARATKDPDVELIDSAPLTAEDLQNLFDSALDVDLGDACTFAIRRPRQVRREDESPSTWRVVIDMQVARQHFESATLDVVTTANQASSGVDDVVVRPVLGGESFAVRSIDLSRHAAEKTHAYARVYAHDRPSSRVKDLVDLVLLVERDLVRLRPTRPLPIGSIAE